jgi:DNA modification methylase
MNYPEFLEQKHINHIPTGHEVTLNDLNENLFDFQRISVKWALKKGRAAFFFGTGLGKTIAQCSWADNVHKTTGKDIIIFAPLCVAKQTVSEAFKFKIPVNYCREQSQVKPGINITNYEMIERFDMNNFIGVVLDESSILKGLDSKTRKLLIEVCKKVPYKLSCTATPSPNDFMELGSQAEFLGVMSQVEMLATFFIHDGGDTSKWRLKGHGKSKFWEWMATWAITINKPSDLGFDDDGYILPELHIVNHVIESEEYLDGELFIKEAQTLMERKQAARRTIDKRIKKCVELVNNSTEQWAIWCNLNDESEQLAKLIPDAKDIKGADSIDKKEQIISEFINGSLRVLISKPSITGFGLNFQFCRNTVFVGLNDSFEAYYQAVRRFYRFGQTREVYAHLISTDIEGNVKANLERKQKLANDMSESMVQHMRSVMEKEIFGSKKETIEYKRDVVKTDKYELHQADCIDLAKEIKTNSIGYTVFSPPFASLYTYSNSERDMGNSKSHDEFYIHFKFLIKELYRITMHGRLLSFHCMNLPTSKQNDGFIGIRDFRGELIRMFIDEGWIYHSEVVIWKDPVTAMQRTKALGLLHKTIRKDSAMSRQGIPDYLVTMRKPGDNVIPISHTHESFPVQLWQQYASPIWMDINPSDTLQFRTARENDDERHICPLQLQVIERAINLWSKEGDLVYSPFTGIGSEGYVALNMGRNFIGSELKKSYFDLAKRNLSNAVNLMQFSLFDL